MFNRFPKQFVTYPGHRGPQISTYIRVGDKLTTSEIFRFDSDDEKVPPSEAAFGGIVFKPLKNVPADLDDDNSYDEDPERVSALITFKDKPTLQLIIDQLVELREEMEPNHEDH